MSSATSGHHATFDDTGKAMPATEGTATVTVAGTASTVPFGSSSVIALLTFIPPDAAYTIGSDKTAALTIASSSSSPSDRGKLVGRVHLAHRSERDGFGDANEPVRVERCPRRRGFRASLPRRHGHGNAQPESRRLTRSFGRITGGLRTPDNAQSSIDNL